jgi:RNA polymerase sigma-70 factor (ECF subfamily)
MFWRLDGRHLAMVRGRIQGIARSASDADDIMQEAQLKTWRRLGSYRSESSFRTWMTSIAINEARQFYRKANRFSLVHDRAHLAELTSPSELPYQACVRAELTEKLIAAVERLPAKHKQVVVLHNLREFSLQETAQELQVTTPALKSRLFQAKAALSKALIPKPGGLGRPRTSTPKTRALLSRARRLIFPLSST